MPWQPKDLMQTKLEFVTLALKEGANRRELCRRFGISPKTGYALLKRFAAGGASALQPRSRRPLLSPMQSAPQLEQAVIAMRTAHPRWGGRKLSAALGKAGIEPPTPSTVTRILHRHGLITPEASEAATPWQRFEHDAPNALWQMDFKGHFETGQGRCNPLTILDEHSRYSLAIAACAKADTATVQSQMAQVFRRYGLALQTPATRYLPSPRSYSSTLAPITYCDEDEVLEVGCNGLVQFKGRKLHLSSALHRLPVAFRADPNDDQCFDIMFCHHRVTRVDLARSELVR